MKKNKTNLEDFMNNSAPLKLAFNCGMMQDRINRKGDVMKKCLALLLTMVLAVSAAGCGAAATNQNTLEIVVVPQAWSDELDGQIKAHVKDRPQLNVYQNAPEEPDGRYQSLLVEDLMAQQVDVICLDVTDPVQAEPKIKAAEEAGILVLTGADFLAMIDQAEEMLSK